MWLSPQDIYELIKEYLLKEYAKSIKEGWKLSEYFANEIISSWDKANIDCVLENLKNTQEYDNKKKITSILEKLRNFYENYRESIVIGVNQENEPDDIKKLDTKKLSNRNWIELRDIEIKLFDILRIKYVLSWEERNMFNEDEYRKGYEEIVLRGLNENVEYLQELARLEEEIDNNTKLINELRKKELTVDIATKISDIEKIDRELREKAREINNYLSEPVWGILNRVDYDVGRPHWDVEIKFSEKLFLELKKYKWFYDVLIEKNDKFDIDKKTRVDFFNTLLEWDYKNGIEDQKDLLERIWKNIDHFKWLDDEQYIDLFFALHPDLNDTAKGVEENVLHCINIIRSMKWDEFEDFINLIKTTTYWTDDVSEECYDVAKLRWMWDFIMDNYAMWYFKSIKSEELMKDLNWAENIDGLVDERYIKDMVWRYKLKYLPVFKWLVSEGDLKSKEIPIKEIARCHELMRNRNDLKSGWRWRVNPEE